MQINECEHLLLISSLCSHSAWSYSWDCDKSFGVHIRVSHNWLRRALYIHQRDPSLRSRRASGRITQLNRVKACAPLQISKSCFYPHVCGEKGLLKRTKTLLSGFLGWLSLIKTFSFCADVEENIWSLTNTLAQKKVVGGVFLFIILGNMEAKKYCAFTLPTMFFLSSSDTITIKKVLTARTCQRLQHLHHRLWKLHILNSKIGTLLLN